VRCAICGSNARLIIHGYTVCAAHGIELDGVIASGGSVTTWYTRAVLDAG